MISCRDFLSAQANLLIFRLTAQTFVVINLRPKSGDTRSQSQKIYGARKIRGVEKRPSHGVMSWELQKEF